MTRRIFTMIRRYLVLHLRSPARMFDLVFWPTLELLVWGFLSIYLSKNAEGNLQNILLMLLSAIIFWDVLYRSQQAISLGFMEELWSRNILNLVISPLRTWEWVASAYAYATIKTFFIMILMLVLAMVMYTYDATVFGFYMVPLLINLLLLGYAMGMFATGLLLRWGHAAESLIWGVPFLVQPFAAIFYPVSVYPDWLKPICLALPVTHVMEAMRTLLNNGTFSWANMALIFGLNLLYMAACGWFFAAMLARGRENGRLVRLTD